MRGNDNRRNVNLCPVATIGSMSSHLLQWCLSRQPLWLSGTNLWWSGSMRIWPGGPNGAAGGKSTGPWGGMGGSGGGGGGGVTGGGAMAVVGLGEAAGVERCPLAQDSAIARGWSRESSGLAARTIMCIYSSNRICRRGGSSVRVAGTTGVAAVGEAVSAAGDRAEDADTASTAPEGPEAAGAGATAVAPAGATACLLYTSPSPRD